MDRLNRIAGLLLMLCVFLIAGCESHKVQGVVVAGKIAGIEVVDKDDVRLTRNGIPDAQVSSILEPRGMHPELLPTTTTDQDGRFSIPVERFGAGGLQEYDINIAAQAYGYSTTDKSLKIPWSHKRVLITVIPGKDTYERPRDFLRETLELKEQYLK